MHKIKTTRIDRPPLSDEFVHPDEKARARGRGMPRCIWSRSFVGPSLVGC